jgi:hypothetical protein
MKMKNKIILYEPIEMQNNFAVEDLSVYKKIKQNQTTKNVQFYIQFFDE